MSEWFNTILSTLALPEYGLSAVFVMSFISATLVPIGSEPIMFGILKVEPDMFWSVVVIATVGNTLGGAFGWWTGHIAHKLRDTLTKKETSGHDARILNWLHSFGPKACLFSWLPVVGDPMCILAGWIRLPFWPCVAYMCVGKFIRYVIFMAGLLTVFPAHWVISH
jgi:membrane protein YqaA with SNARE-associated domain